MILQLAYRRYRLPFRQPVRTAHGLWTEREGLLIRLEAEGGGRAYGDVAPIPWFGTEDVEEAEKLCRDLGTQVSGATLETLPENCVCLRSAIASAMAHIASPSTPAPTGVVDTKAFPVAALLPAGRAALSQVGPRAEAGFRTFKWKVGVGAIDDELALFDDLLAELPEGARLRLDANGAWDRRKAERWLERCAERPVEFVEQPCWSDARGGGKERSRADDILMGLAGDYPTPLALDESVVSTRDVDAWLGRGWPGVYVIKPSLLGNPTESLARLEKAKAPVVFSSALETAIGAKAALRRAFAYSGERRALGFGVWPLFQDGRLDGPAQAPFLRASDVDAIDEEAAWNALS